MSTTATPTASNQQALQPSYVSQPSMATPTTTSVNVSPQSTIQQILQGFQPQAQQSTSNLNSTLAAMGIVGGGAQQAQDALQGQLASSLAPTLAQAIQGSQGTQLNQAQTNAAAANQMTGLNLQDQMYTNFANQNAANNMQSQLANYIMQGWSEPLSAYTQLQTGGLGAAGSIASGAAQDYPVYQPQTLLGSLGL